MSGSIWTRPTPAASARETLTREQIVAAALALLDEEGLTGLSMRKLAARLEAGTTSLYWHVSTKDDLLDLVIDEVYAEVDLPGADLAGWRGALTLMAHSLRGAVLRHPWVPGAIFGRSNIGPQSLSLGSRCLGVLEAAGFEGDAIDHALAAVFAYVFGATTAEVAWRAAVRDTGQSPGEWSEEIYEEVMPVTEPYPELHRSMQRRSGSDPDLLQSQAFSFGLESVLDGLEARLSA